MHHVHPSRSFIAPEVDLLCHSCNLANVPPELLMAQGVIIEHDVGAGTSGGSKVNNKKRVRDDGSPGPSKRRTGSTVKKEEISANARRAQRIQDLQVSRAN